MADLLDSIVGPTKVRKRLSERREATLLLAWHGMWGALDLKGGAGPGSIDHTLAGAAHSPGRLNLLNQLGAQASKLLIRDRSGFLEPIEFFDLVGNAVADHLPQFLTCLLRLLGASLRHAA
jgi:hypothetical protein